MSRKRSSTSKVENHDADYEVPETPADYVPETPTAMQHWHEHKRRIAKAFEEEKARVCEDFKLKVWSQASTWYYQRNPRFYEHIMEAQEQWRKDFENRKKEARRNLIVLKLRIKANRMEYESNRLRNLALQLERSEDSEKPQGAFSMDGEDSDFWDEMTNRSDPEGPEEENTERLDEQTKERPPKRAKTKALKESEAHLLNCIKAWAECWSEHLQATP